MLSPNQINFASGKTTRNANYSKNQSLANNVIPHHVQGYSSPQSHPESVFFKPKINVSGIIKLTESGAGQQALKEKGAASANTSSKPVFHPPMPAPNEARDANAAATEVNNTLGTIPSPKQKEETKIVTEPPTKKAAGQHASAPQAEQEEIVFSDKHSLDDYVIGKQIGQGAYAVVRIGMHKQLNKKVALKIYEKEKIKDI